MAKGIFCTSLRPMFVFASRWGARVSNPFCERGGVATGRRARTNRKEKVAGCRARISLMSMVNGARNGCHGRRVWGIRGQGLFTTYSWPVLGGGRGMPFAAVHAHGLANPAGEATVPGQSNRPFPGQPDSATRSRGTPLVVTASWPAIAQIKTVDVIGDVAACGIWFASGGGGGSQQGSARVVRRGRL